MKKLFAILLAVAVICALSVTAFAAEESKNAVGEFTPIDVTGTVNELGYAHTYKVTLSYTSMAFEYSEGTRTWDAENMVWGAPNNAWVTDKATITITNQSSKDIEATVIAAGENGVNLAVTGEGFASNKIMIGKADKGYNEQGAAVTKTLTVTATGAPAFGTTDFGSITVSFADYIPLQ